MSTNKDPLYCQCRFERPTPEGKYIDTAWIPEKFGKKGAQFFLKTDPYRNIWTVTFVGSKKPESFLTEHQMDYKHQRKMSDV